MNPPWKSQFPSPFVWYIYDKRLVYDIVSPSFFTPCNHQIKPPWKSLWLVYVGLNHSFFYREDSFPCVLSSSLIRQARCEATCGVRWGGLWRSQWRYESTSTWRFNKTNGFNMIWPAILKRVLNKNTIWIPYDVFSSNTLGFTSNKWWFKLLVWINDLPY